MERSRFGAYLVAIRENEDAARALGVDTLRVKLQADHALGRHHRYVGRALRGSIILFVDATIAYGPWISVEALLVPIIGGLGTVFGPLVGAVALHALGEGTKAVAGRIPGIDLALFGALLHRGGGVRAEWPAWTGSDAWVWPRPGEART